MSKATHIVALNVSRHFVAPLDRAAIMSTIKSCLFFVITLQKIAVPGTSSTFSLSFLVMIITIPRLFWLGMLVDTRALMTLGALSFIAALSYTVVGSDSFSLMSLALVVVVQSFLIFRVTLTDREYDDLISFFIRIMVVLAIIGIVQYFSQFAIGRYSFALDLFLPEPLLMRGFNLMNPLYYNSPLFKSNGVIFLEPSIFNQFLSIAFVAEMLRKQRILIMGLLALALMVTYSGTGLTMLALAIPYHVIRQRRLGILTFGAVMLALAIPLGSLLGLNALTDRVNEFSEKQSSGYSRFMGVIPLLQYALHGSDGSLFVGRGPGSVQEYFTKVDFGTFDPTWGKLIYEYGLSGLMIYSLFLYFCVVQGRSGLRFPVGYTFLLLGGYLSNPMMTGLMAILVAWPSRSASNV